jgi:hypothetical protein
MGWAHCGTDDMGREIGYGIPATCDHPDCNKPIDRGLAYCCGGMHGGQGYYDEDLKVYFGCGRYFCTEHLSALGNLCAECVEDYERLESEAS